MSWPRVRIHKIAWNGNDGEVWYTDAAGAATYLCALLRRFGFQFGTPLARFTCVSALQALPVVKRGCSLTELQDVCRNDPEVEISPQEQQERRGQGGATVGSRGPMSLAADCPVHLPGC
jgi:hypothetical protein